MLQAGDALSGAADVAAYTPVNTVHTDRVNNDGTLTPIVNITAVSDLYGVQFTFTILESVWQSNGGPEETANRTSWVNALCALPHVQGFYTEQDQGNDQILYNFAVITVGDSLTGVTDVARVRMDHLNSPGAFAAVDAAYQRVLAMGTPAGA